VTVGALLILQHEAAQAPAPGGEAHLATPFDINTGLIFWTLIIFGLLMALLWRFAWPTILRSVEERERRMQRQLEDAERARAEAERLLGEHKAILAGARAEAEDVITKAKSVAQKEREGLLARAREEQDAMVARARREIDEEKQKAILALRREAVDLAVAAASKLVAGNLDTAANRKLALDYLATLQREGGSPR
jgi:F-type H+-transporting ATPase subunit b